MRRLLAALTALALGVLLTGTPARAAEREKWDTRVFALVPPPGAPAYVHVHTNGHVYAGTYAAPSDQRSAVFEWTRDGRLLHSWRVPGQDPSGEHGVQVAGQTRAGRLIVLDTSTSRILLLSPTTGRWRTVATLPEGSVPNYVSWGPRGLFVTDYANGVIYRVARSGRVRVWLRDPALDGVAGFGTTGIRYLPGQHAFYVTQQTDSTGGTAPTNGVLLRIGVDDRGRPDGIEPVWSSAPTDLPDGFGIGRSGHVYIAMAGLTNRLVEVDPRTGETIDSFPDSSPDSSLGSSVGSSVGTPGTGDNGSTIPFDTPCSATFLGRSVLVANQSAVAEDSTHMAVLDVHVAERGRAPYLPSSAGFSARR
ncbi:SMP-30/gluconolactonase/LRE family protein [Nocardioides acrostichi]|uniref:Uncharacterized protein n=1 Tax=Nocardioides acrostichi TaxID=2784339 RepID=A0A930Y6Z4_9ACTN|nr:hypothetical protein [Nocardioides acrostichi]MBF4161512.1 hypothetical protein [Nocardioides acrostichi]